MNKDLLSLIKSNIKKMYKKNIESVIKQLKDDDMNKLKERADFGGIILLATQKKKRKQHQNGQLHCSDQSFEQRYLDGRFEKSFLGFNKNVNQGLLNNDSNLEPNNFYSGKIPQQIDESDELENDSNEANEDTINISEVFEDCDIRFSLYESQIKRIIRNIDTFK